MQGTSIKITGPDGQPWRVPFAGVQMSIGRTPDNAIVLEQGGVSSHHCVIGRDPTGAFLIQDQGSTNGTWIGEQRIAGMVPLHPGVAVMVGSYMLMLETGTGAVKPLTAVGVARPAGLGARPIGVGTAGPLIRKSDTEHRDRQFHDRVGRYAAEWDKNGRPARLLLRGRNLAQALELLESDGDPDLHFGELEESFIRASKEGRERNKVVRRIGIGAGSVLLIAAVAVLATYDFEDDEVVAEAEVDDEAEAKKQDDKQATEEVKAIIDPSGGDDAEKATIEHTVIPAETVEEIALRYDVSIQAVMRWNGIDESTPLEPGRKLEIHTSKAPLAQQQLTYRPDKRESWSSLAIRFDVPVSKLQAYNPDIPDNVIKPGVELSIWVDPKPLKKKADVQIPEFTVRKDAISIGAPQNGKIENGIQFPPNDKLYKRRNPQIMWCAAHMAENLQRAIASFRYTYDFEGEIVVADMSHQRGGPFNPHKSHQAGRDVDIWLPSLKGVYQPSHIKEGKERRPYADEADWFALYGFLKALHETGEVQAVFLMYDLHDRVYKAAKLMGASDAELEQMIAYPRGQHFRGSLLQHSAGHDRHIHVRFKCGPNDLCDNVHDNDPGD
jgi:LysM repeat protein